MTEPDVMIDEYSDLESEKLKEHFAVIYTPRQQRTRFPENCVQLVDSALEAKAEADRKPGFYPAQVVGPSRSSEGLQIYYLVRWLD